MSNTNLGTEIAVSLGTLPSPPFVAMEIIRLTRDADAAASDVAEVLSHDPVLTTRILQVANSPAYGLTREVSTVERATALLGLKAVKMMALSFSLAADVGDDAGALSLDTYWFHSLLNAVAARRWAELTAPGLAEEAFLAGLLSNMGRLVLARTRTQEYAGVMESAHTDWPSEEDEVEVFGYSSNAVTAIMLADWGLPDIITAAVKTALCGEPVDEDVNGAAELAQVIEAGRKTESLLAAAEAGTGNEVLGTVAAEMGVEAPESLLAEIEERLSAIAETLGIDLSSEGSYQHLLDEARDRLVAVSLETAMSLETETQRADQLEESNQELETIAYKDQLTGIPNRRAFDEHLARIIAHGARQGSAVGVALFDIDHFKSFNDTYGHQVGDDVLREVARAISATTRAGEMVARYGGEEFVLVIENGSVGDLEVASERIRRTVEAMSVRTKDHGELSVTISGGAYLAVPVSNNDGEHMCKLADDALYRAKDHGRNRVVIRAD